MQLLIVSAVVFFLELLIYSVSAQVTPITEFPDYISARACLQEATSSGI